MVNAHFIDAVFNVYLLLNKVLDRENHRTVTSSSNSALEAYYRKSVNALTQSKEQLDHIIHDFPIKAELPIKANGALLQNLRDNLTNADAEIIVTIQTSINALQKTIDSMLTRENMYFNERAFGKDISNSAYGFKTQIEAIHKLKGECIDALNNAYETLEDVFPPNLETKSEIKSAPPRQSTPPAIAKEDLISPIQHSAKEDISEKVNAQESHYVSLDQIQKEVAQLKAIENHPNMISPTTRGTLPPTPRSRSNQNPNSPQLPRRIIKAESAKPQTTRRSSLFNTRKITSIEGSKEPEAQGRKTPTSDRSMHFWRRRRSSSSISPTPPRSADMTPQLNAWGEKDPSKDANDDAISIKRLGKS